MSRLIAQIMLSILLFPLAGLVYFLSVVFHHEFSRNWSYIYGGLGIRRDEQGLLLAGLVAWAFVACYWIALWRKSVHWTSGRSTLTALCFVGAAFGGVVLSWTVNAMVREDEIAIFVGTAFAPLIWQVGTILVWRETDAERGARIARQGAGELACPTCGYNLSGLKGTRCPECGSEFTLDALIASQPAKRQAEVEG